MIATKIELFFEADKKNNAAVTFKVEVHHNTCPATFAILLFSDVVMCRRVGYLELDCQEPGISQK